MLRADKRPELIEFEVTMRRGSSSSGIWAAAERKVLSTVVGLIRSTRAVSRMPQPLGCQWDNQPADRLEAA
jgi:hypothetical protein